MAASKKLKTNDRVKRTGTQAGPYGVIKEIREEVTSAAITQENKDRALMVTVLWDNGTQSCFAPDSLEVVKE